MNFSYEGKNKIAELLINCDTISKRGYIVFFENKVLAITLESSYIKATNKELKKKYKADGIGFFKRMGKTDDYWKDFGDRFLYMSIEEIISEFKKVIEISYVDINKYKLSPFKKDGTVNDGDVEDKEGEILIKGNKVKISFYHRYSIDTPEYKQMIDILENKAINAKGNIER